MSWGDRGQESRRAKLTEDDVRAIKRALASGASILGLAKEYGVGKTTISQIKTGRTWSHVKASPQNASHDAEKPGAAPGL